MEVATWLWHFCSHWPAMEGDLQYSGTEHQQVHEIPPGAWEEFQGGKPALFVSWGFQRRCIWTCSEVRKGRALELCPFHGAECHSRRSGGWQRCAPGLV